MAATSKTTRGGAGASRPGAASARPDYANGSDPHPGAGQRARARRAQAARDRRANSFPPETGATPATATRFPKAVQEGKTVASGTVTDTTVPGTAAPSQAAVSVPGDSGGWSEQAGGGLLALFLWPLVFNLVKGGPGQMWGWVKAKFINEPYSGGGTAPAKATPQQSVAQLRQSSPQAELRAPS
jgi:hypothetical protein